MPHGTKAMSNFSRSKVARKRAKAGITAAQQPVDTLGHDSEQKKKKKDKKKSKGGKKISSGGKR